MKAILNSNPKLTPREIEIIHYIAYEYSTKQIAGLLFLSTETIKTHRKNILNKLNVKNVAGIVRKSYMMRILKFENPIKEAI